jgi:hypothetical protein
VIAPPAGQGQRPAAAPNPQLILQQLTAMLQQQNRPQLGAEAAIMHKISKMILPLYRGRTDTKSPYEYIKMIKNQAKQNNIDPFLLVKHKLPTTLIGEANLWLSFHKELDNWEKFEVAFMQEYSAVDYIKRLKRELESRTQGQAEPLTTYIHKMYEMCMLIDNNFPEQEIIERIMDQMHPEYRSYMRDKNFTTILELETHAKLVQTAFFHDKQYKPPPQAHESVENTFAYNDPKANFKVAFDNTQTQPKNYPVALSAVNPQITRERARDKRSQNTRDRDDSRGRRQQIYGRQSDRDSSRDRYSSKSPYTSETDKSRSPSPYRKSQHSHDFRRDYRRDDRRENRRDGSDDRRVDRREDRRFERRDDRRERSDSREYRRDYRRDSRDRDQNKNKDARGRSPNSKQDYQTKRADYDDRRQKSQSPAKNKTGNQQRRKTPPPKQNTKN